MNCTTTFPIQLAEASSGDHILNNKGLWKFSMRDRELCIQLKVKCNEKTQERNRGRVGAGREGRKEDNYLKTVDVLCQSTAKCLLFLCFFSFYQSFSSLSSVCLEVVCLDRVSLWISDCPEDQTGLKISEICLPLIPNCCD